MKRRRIKISYPGFSLIEIAIVLAILGVLLSGVIKGKDLYDNARLNALIHQIHDIQISVQQFQEKFGALPGDFSKAAEQIKADLINGNGDGQIKGDERNNVWPNLNASGLYLSTVEPASKIGGVISIQSGPKDDFPGTWIVIGEKSGDNNFGALLTPEQALFIDKKIDSGNSSSGRVRAYKGDNGAGECVDGTGNYNIQNKKPACILFIEL